MSARTKRLIVIVLVAVHLLMLGAYTLPPGMVQKRMQQVALRYVRPLFHQQWHLFAPDPPLCSCVLQVDRPAGEWHGLVPGPFDPLRHRMARHLAEYVQEGVEEGRTRPIPILQKAIRSMVRDVSREGGRSQFRLVERCVEDPDRPMERSERITMLEFDRP